MAAKARAGPGESQEPGVSSGSSMSVGHLPLLSHVGFEPTPLWDARVMGSGLTMYATKLGLLTALGAS